MSGPLEDALRRFTPSPGGLDRDALLFAAGRASARPGRKWPTLAALLALSQALTLALLVAGTPTPHPAPPPAPPSASEPGESTPAALVVRPWRLTLDDIPPPESGTADLVPDEPPLYVSSRFDPFAE